MKYMQGKNQRRKQHKFYRGNVIGLVTKTYLIETVLPNNTIEQQHSGSDISYNNHEKIYYIYLIYLRN